MAATYKSKIAALSKRKQSAVRGAIRVAGRQIRDLAKELAPVDTGYLRSSIRVNFDFQLTRHYYRAQIVATAPYAIYVELGTIYSPAQPFLGPALRAIVPKLPELIRQAFRKK